MACVQENTNSTQNGNGKYGPILFLQAYQTLSVLVDLVYAHCHGSLVAGLQTCGLLISVLHAFGPTYWLFQLEVRLFFFQTHMLAEVAQIAYYGGSPAGGSWVQCSAGQAYSTLHFLPFISPWLILIPPFPHI